MPTITENNPQLFRVLQMVQQRGHEALASGAPSGRVIFADLTWSGPRFHEWSWPAIQEKGDIVNLGKTP